ncbi:MAG: methylenetetrahydrofolate reductase [NAD(P)H] [Bacteroidales bacterium]|nr:methylenetetrahydrofolate reductase [NAD(P)H] [Candidatus Cryptobacteroides faecihippi]MCQ2162136.1 methylenetetrahydrofolate reductase [NAD(P)H] [Bacteroidales bacterium]
MNNLAKDSKPYASLEIVPPLTGISKEQLINDIRPFTEFNPRFINVTCHRDEIEYVEQPDGTYSRRLVRRRVSETAVCGAIQSELKVDVVPHIICGGASAQQIDFQLQDFKFMGISNVLALRGDCLAGEKRFTPAPDGYSHASELVEAIRRFEKANDCEGFFRIGVGGYPEKHFEAPNLEIDIENLKKKVDAGADYVIVQMFYDNEVFYSYVDKCRAAGIDIPIIPGIKPISTYRHLQLLPESFSIDIPVDLAKEIEAHRDDKAAIYRIGQEWATAQCKDLLAHGVPAIHFYTMGKSANVIGILKECF